MKKIIMMSTALLAVTACTSVPEPEIIEAPVAVAPPPAPPEPVLEPIPEARAEPIPYVEPQQYSGLPEPGSQEDFAYQSGGEARVFFGYDQFDLSPQARDALRAQAGWLMIYPHVTAVIEGHADERGTRDYNLALGARRADSVKAFLVSQGIAPSRLRAISYGKERPIDPRPTEEGWARNRNAYTNLRLDGLS